VKRTYDRTEAENLRPLLESIAKELDERSIAIANLERRQRRLKLEGVSGEVMGNLVAELATHKREIRLATEELDRLGASADVGSKTVVHLPGPDGSLETGFRVSAGDGAFSEAPVWTS
jgi:hypothetical protein